MLLEEFCKLADALVWPLVSMWPTLISWFSSVCMVST